MSTLQLKRGTKANIDLLAGKGGLLNGEPLFFTDLEKFAVATSPTTYQTFAREETIGFDVRTANNNALATGQLSWDTVKYNSGAFDVANHEFVAPYAGLYAFESSVLISDTAPTGGYLLIIACNDSIDASGKSVVHYKYKQAGQHDSVAACTTMQLDQGDIVNVWSTFVAANTMYVITPDCRRYNRFSGHLIGRL